MKQLKTTINLLCIAICISLSSCGNDEPSLKDAINEEFTDGAQPELEISEEILDEIISGIPSPIEMTSLIKMSGASYNKAIVNDATNIDKYSEPKKKAIGLGIYGADLGYMNIYEKSFAALDYLNNIRKLTDDLKIGQFFDFETLQRLSKSSKNVDSLIAISTENFSKMDFYLREQKRGNISVLIVTGTWMEGLYLATQIAKSAKSEELNERIGEQKITLDNIMIILSIYKNDPFFAEIYSQMENLKKVFDKVEIQYTYGEPIKKEVDGKLIIEDNSSSTIKLTPAILTEITQEIEKIRTGFIN
jgi:hypothetical protein